MQKEAGKGPFKKSNRIWLNGPGICETRHIVKSKGMGSNPRSEIFRSKKLIKRFQRHYLNTVEQNYKVHGLFKHCNNRNVSKNYL